MITRPPPPPGPVPIYAVAGRAFRKSSMRPIVITTCIVGIIWSLIWAVGAFQDVGGDKQNDNLKKLAIFDIVLGALYSAVTVIEFFGLYAGITRRITPARIFVGLAAIAVALVGSAELIRTIVHFTFKNSLIDECTNEATGSTFHTSFGFWGGGVTQTLSPAAAHDFCADVYSRRTFSTIAWLVLVLLFGSFFASTAYSYYRQLLDPNAFRTQLAPSEQFRLDALRHNEQPYAGGYAPYPQPDYAPPPGPPPRGYGHDAPPYEGGQLPGYGTEFPARDMGDEKSENRSEDRHEERRAADGAHRGSETDLNQRL